MVTALYWPESSKIIQKHVEDFEGFGMLRVKARRLSVFPMDKKQVLELSQVFEAVLTFLKR